MSDIFPGKQFFRKNYQFIFMTGQLNPKKLMLVN